MTMGGQQQLGAAERLRVYRRCFHELDEQLMQLQASGGIQDLDPRKMQAELRALEDLIVIFTDLNSALTAKQWEHISLSLSLPLPFTVLSLLSSPLLSAPAASPTKLLSAVLCFLGKRFPSLITPFHCFLFHSLMDNYLCTWFSKAVQMLDDTNKSLNLWALKKASNKLLQILNLWAN